MRSYPKAFSRFFPNLIYTLAIPAFFLVAVLLYEPAALCRLMHTGEEVSPIQNLYYFNTVICFAIILGVMILERLFLWLMRKTMPMTLWRFSFWCLGEIVTACAFTALYLVLTSRGADTWFAYWGMSISSIGSVLIYPYIILSLLYCYLDPWNGEYQASDARLKFYDSRHQLKFITSASSILYFEADENYIILHFLENGEEKKYSLRNTLKSIEPLCAKAGFVRTHRGFIVNPAHVKQVRKEPGGFYFADLGTGREEGIPVSKKYYDALVSAL